MGLAFSACVAFGAFATGDSSFGRTFGIGHCLAYWQALFSGRRALLAGGCFSLSDADKAPRALLALVFLGFPLFWSLIIVISFSSSMFSAFVLVGNSALVLSLSGSVGLTKPTAGVSAVVVCICFATDIATQ